MPACALALTLVLFGQGQSARPSPKTDAMMIDKMAADGKSQKEISQYVFDTHGCKSCHLAGKDGKLGFTDRGREIGKGFEGCVSMLSAMNLIAQVSDAQRNPELGLFDQRTSRIDGGARPTRCVLRLTTPC